MAASTSKTLLGVGCALIAVLFWSGNYIAARMMAGVVPPVTLTFLRWFLAFLLLLPFCLQHFRREYPIIRRHWLYFAALAFIGVSAFNPFIYIAGKTTSALNLVLLSVTSPIFTVLLGLVFLREHFSPLRLLGVLAAFGGVVVILLPAGGNLHTLAGFHFRSGDLLTLLAAFTFAVYTIQLRYMPEGVGGRSVILIMAGLGVVPLIPFMFLEFGLGAQMEISLRSLGSILYLAACASIGGYVFWNKAVELLGPSGATPIYYLLPFFSGTEGLLILGEPVTGHHWIGGMIIILGLILAGRGGGTKKRSTTRD